MKWIFIIESEGDMVDVLIEKETIFEKLYGEIAKLFHKP